MRVPSPDQIDALYAAVGEPDALRRMAEVVRGVMAVDNAGIWLSDRSGVSDLVVTDNIQASAKPYLDYYQSLDPWSRTPMPLNTVYLGSDALPEAELVRTEFYNDFARHFGMVQPMGATLELGEDRLVSVSTSRDPGALQLEEADKAPLAGCLAHLRGALVLHRRFREQDARIRGREAAFDRLNFGVVICDADGGIHFVNDAAADLETRRFGFSLGRRGRGIEALERTETLRLRALLHAAGSDGRPGWMRLTGEHGRGVGVLVTPLPGEDAPRRIMVSIRPSETASAPDEALLRQLFGLSPAQAALASLLATGLSFEEVAERRGIAKTTARTHYSAVLLKTGTRSLRELLHLLQGLPASSRDRR